MEGMEGWTEGGMVGGRSTATDGEREGGRQPDLFCRGCEGSADRVTN